ncbi:MAG: multidrug DMT transporter permease [Legionellales bacterium]|nr:multidrug DMT transporter permease [Legionellales bacterium]
MRGSHWAVLGVLTWLWVGPSSAISPAPEIDCERHHCTAIVDAGSSGSRIHLYSYDLDEQANPIRINNVYSKKVKPGLASIPDDQISIDAYFSQLLQDFPKQSIPMYLYATAGMRLLPEDSQNQYYTDIKQWFSAHPQWSLVEARTISGQEEGIYGWLSLNYYLQTLQDVSKPLVGLLEVGGASAQIAFPLDETQGIDARDRTEVTVYGRHITLFSHSFLGLGANEVFAHSQDLPVCFPQGYPLKEGVLAEGNAAQCQTKLGPLLQQEYHVNAVTQPALQQTPIAEWYTVSSVSVMASQSPFVFSDQTFTAQTLLQQADMQYCQQTYQHLLESDLDKDYIAKNCLLASYFSGLLLSGFGFSPEQSIHYLPEYDGNWAVGVLFIQ